MDNDDKLTSGNDETPPDTEAEDLAAKDDSADNGAKDRRTERVGNTIVFSKLGRRHDGPPVDTNFGMPDFSFPPQEAEIPVDRAPAFNPEPSVEDALIAARTGLERPLREGTGWEPTGSIELSGRQEDGGVEDFDSVNDEAPPETSAAQRAQATVMPFPGAAMQRAQEPTPSDILRGSAEPREVEMAAPLAEPAENAPDFDVAAQDTLADAVQSALRNVYGGQSPAREEETPDLSGYTVAESLRRAAEHTSHDEAWPPQGNNWRDDRQETFQEAERNADTIEATTDSVLDYLYGQRRGSSTREGTVLSANSSLRDFGEAAGYNEEWQDNPEFDDRSQPPGGLRDFGGMTYPGTQAARYPQPPGERAFARDGGAYRPDARAAEWDRPSYLSNNEGRFPRGQYPAPLPAASSESLSSGTPDSGHLLGAAGLGLIGGIALAGVLAVFVFNSFVDEGDQAVAEVTPKFNERLAASSPTPVPPADAPRPVTRDVPDAESAPQVRTATAPVEPPQPDRSTARPAPQVSLAPDQKLYASDVNGSAGAPVSLDIKLGNAADGEDTLISLKGLPPEARLSTGIDVGGGQWLLPPAKLRDLTVTLPQGAAGSYNLEVQLLKDDAQTSLSEPIPFGLTIGRGGAKPGDKSRASQKGEDTARLGVLPDETPQIETDVLTQLLIRDGNKLMRDGDIAGARRLYEQAASNGNPEAALAMGRSFDPSYFEKLPVKTGKPDPATAFEWYKKALEGGLVTARVKIDGLKQWLQR
jgi:hypothetical protein